MAGGILSSLVAVAGCESANDKNTPTAPNARSQAVVREGPAAPAETAAAVSVAPSAEAPAPPPRSTPLCSSQLNKPGKALSKVELDRQVAENEAELPEALPIGKGRWTWINFWAAWCVPCREEIPRLKGWEQKLNAETKRFDLVFISLDDDPRQLTQFLAKQPAAGLKRTYWIKEGDAREEWFGALDLDPDPQLPTHILVDPKGHARCVVNGAVEDSDFATVRGIVQG